MAVKSATRGTVSLTFFALCAFGILIALGVWQLERRTWKNGLIERLEAGLSAPPRPYRPGDPELSHVTLKGTFMGGATVKLLWPTPEAARRETQEGFGYQLFTPLAFQGGVVFVNRGFVPDSMADNVSAPLGETELRGLVRLSRPPGWFTPAAEPAKRVFFDTDIPGMTRAAGLPEAKVIEGEYIQADRTPDSTGWPMAGDPRELLASIPNRHLEYAFTWFGLATTLAGVYAASLLRR